ncbi:hypothetical protein HWV62_11291 [Athelia sp. TMB]|nr:hypothetical protein HWV62_11291 [Athelia sp. TMB]
MSNEPGRQSGATAGAEADMEKHAEDPSIPSLSSKAPATRTSFLSSFRAFALDLRCHMAVIITIAGLIMCAHDALHRYLDGRVVPQTYTVNEQSIMASMRSIFRSQEVVSALSIVIANCERVLLAMAIGIAFIQVFWMFLRKNQYSIEQIDNFMATRSSPFTPSSIATLFSSAFLLTVMALCATGMTAVTAFAPGSLDVLPDQMILNSTCTVPIVDVANGNYGAAVVGTPGTKAWPKVAELVMRAIVQERPIPPSAQYLTCGHATCQYSIEFFAPALECIDVTDSVDFNITLPNHTTGLGLATVWNSSYAWGSSGFTLSVSLVQGDYNDSAWTFQAPHAFSCTANNATYGVTVLYTGDGSAAVGNISLDYVYNHERLPGEVPFGLSSSLADQIIQMNGIVDAFAYGMEGDITYGSNGLTGDSTPTAVQYTQLSGALVGNANVTNWTAIIPTLMQQTSLSLLSGSFDVRAGSNSISAYNTTCLSYGDFYYYTQWKLLATYGVCIGVASLCVLLGLTAVHQNQGGEDLGFRRLLHSARVLYGVDAPEVADGRLPPNAKLGVTPHGYFHNTNAPRW